MVSIDLSRLENALRVPDLIPGLPTTRVILRLRLDLVGVQILIRVLGWHYRPELRLYVSYCDARLQP